MCNRSSAARTSENAATPATTATALDASAAWSPSTTMAAASAASTVATEDVAVMRDFDPGDQEPVRELILGGMRERRARRRGMVEVVVRADTPWTSALALCRSSGFDDVGQDATDTHFALRL